MPKLTISDNEYKTRVKNVKRELVERDIDALYLTSSVSIFYLTGFSHIPTERPAALVIPVNGEITFMGPMLEADHIPLKTRIIERVKTYFDYPGERHPINKFAEFLKQMKLHNKKIGTDNLAGAAGTWGYKGPAISEKLRNASMSLAKDIVEDMRLIKSEEEIQFIKESAKWANLAHSLLQEYSGAGLWDLDVALAASYEASMIMKKTLGEEYEPQRLGSTPASARFRGQVGAKSAIPHSIAAKNPMKKGDTLISGAGSDVGGYSCELERTMFLGTPTTKQKTYFETMLKAQDRAFEVLGPEIKCSVVDEAVAAVFKKARMGRLMRHHTGHGLGLEGHERPWIDIGNKTILKPGMVVSCEPGIYEPGFGGFRHSDTILITDAGTEVLTYYPRDIDSLVIPA